MFIVLLSFTSITIPGELANKAESCGFRASKISSTFGRPWTISPVTTCSKIIVPILSPTFTKSFFVL